MICPICGAENEDGVMLCAQCGADMSGAPQQVAESTPAPVQEEKGKGMGIASLVCGILGLTICCGSLIPNILAIIFAVVSKKKGNKGALPTVGLILGIIGAVFGVIYLIYLFVICGISYASVMASY